MAIRYNIDAVLEKQKPVIVFRGEEYKIKDLTVQEALKSLKEGSAKEEKIKKSQKDRIHKEMIDEGYDEDDEEFEEELEKRVNELTPEESFQDYLPVAIDTLVDSLEDFSRDKAQDITLKEFQALRDAIQKAHSQSYTVEGEEVEESEKK